MLCLKALKSLLRNPKFYIPTAQIHSTTSKNTSLYNPAVQFILDEVQESQSLKTHSSSRSQQEEDGFSTQFNSPVQNEEQEILHPKQHRVSSRNQISHPWGEWVDLMDRLLRDGYFDEIGNPFASNRGLGNKEANLIRTASLNFARDKYQFIRHLSRKHIMVIAGSGCPSIDRKVVNSGKRLRAHVRINEGNVCSSCVLRGDCDRAYVKAREDEGGRTVDVMRILLTYGLDPVIGSVENKPCLNKKVQESVRILLKEMVEIRVEDDCEEPNGSADESTQSSHENGVDKERARIDIPAKSGDWICSKCNFFNFARNVKCLRCDAFSQERLKKFAEEQENLPLKKGDWICDKCKFLNFAKNTRCLHCKENPPKRKLNPGEWECDSCNYVNFSRNMVCLKCDHKRPIASYNAYNASRPVKNNARNRQTRPWFGHEKHDGVDSLDFVESRSEDDTSSLNYEVPNFMRFPVVGGKSDLSRASWKTGLVEKSRNEGNASEGSSGYDSYDDDDDDDMAEWFQGVKKSKR